MKKIIITGLLTAVLASPAFAQVKIDDPWVRATVPQQKVTGAFMRITSAQDARLVSAQSPLAGKVEIHEMVTDKDVMKMRPVAAVELPAGKTVELKPGGLHVMLFDLLRPAREGETVPLVLVVEGRDGKRATIEIAAPVRPLQAMHGGGHER
jgi:periplasmic copper chaperone A